MLGMSHVIHLPRGVTCVFNTVIVASSVISEKVRVAFFIFERFMKRRLGINADGMGVDFE